MAQPSPSRSCAAPTRSQQRRRPANDLLILARNDALTELNRRAWLSIGAAAAGGLVPVAAASKLGLGRIRLSLNENPFGPSPLALQAIKAHLAHLSRYAGEEVAELTKTIAERDNIPIEQIVLGEVLDVLGLYLSANGGPGGEFIYSEPGYTALVNAVAPAGGVVVGVPLNERLENDLPTIATKVNVHTRAIYLINPHNPISTVSEAARNRTWFPSGRSLKRASVLRACARTRSTTASQILGTARRHKPRTPLALPGQGAASARTVGSGVRVVH